MEDPARVGLHDGDPLCVHVPEILLVLDPLIDDGEPSLIGRELLQRLERGPRRLRSSSGLRVPLGDHGRGAPGRFPRRRGRPDLLLEPLVRPPQPLRLLPRLSHRLRELLDVAPLRGPPPEPRREAGRLGARGVGERRRGGARLLLRRLVDLLEALDPGLRIAAGALQAVGGVAELVAVELQLRPGHLQAILQALPRLGRRGGRLRREQADALLVGLDDRQRLRLPGGELPDLGRGRWLLARRLPQRLREGEVHGVVGQPLGLVRELLLLRGRHEGGHAARREQRLHVHQSLSGRRGRRAPVALRGRLDVRRGRGRGVAGPPQARDRAQQQQRRHPDHPPASGHAARTPRNPEFRPAIEPPHLRESRPSPGSSIPRSTA